MTIIPTPDTERLVFCDDWGRFWRSIGWAIAALAVLYTIGICLPEPPHAPAATRSATTTLPVSDAKSDEKPGFILAAILFALAGWGLYRRWVIVDRRADLIRIRCGVGPLSWVRQDRISRYTHVAVHRYENRTRNRRVFYRIVMSGGRRSLVLATLDRDPLFDSPREANSFVRTVAAFCGLKSIEH